MGLTPPNKEEQLTAIKHKLATASKVQKQLKEKFGYGENMFFDLDLLEYRIHNSRKVIAQDLDVASLYGVNDHTAENSVSYAFRGHNNEEFLPEYQFEGLFGEQLNDLIEENRYKINGQKAYKLGHGFHGSTAEERKKNSRKAGQKAYELGVGVHGRTAEEMSEHGRKGYAKGLGKRTAEEMSEHGRKGARKSAEARGAHIWSLDELVSLHEIREESIGKGCEKTRPCMTYVTEKFNERHGTDLTKHVLRMAYSYNKHLFSEEE